MHTCTAAHSLQVTADVNHVFNTITTIIWHRRLSSSATAVCAEPPGEELFPRYWLAENGAHHTDPQVSALVTDSAMGDLQAGNSGAQMH